MKSENKICVNDLDDLLATNGLSRNRAAEITGISRKTLDKAASGQAIRKLTYVKFMSAMQDAGYDTGIDSQPSQENPKSFQNQEYSSAVRQLPGTKRKLTPLQIVDAACEDAKKVDDVLRQLTDRFFDKDDGFQHVDFKQLLYRCREIARHADELEKLLPTADQK